jgi:hypothetical protein
MLYALLAAVRAASRASQISEPRHRQRRPEHDPNAPPEAPNPDFDFGPVPSAMELAKPTATERFTSRLLMLIAFLTVLPIAILLAALFLLH